LPNTKLNKPAPVQEDIEIDGNSVEEPEHPAPNEARTSVFPEAMHEPGDHYVISTGTYYQADLRGFGDHSDEEGQEWESDGETGEI